MTPRAAILAAAALLLAAPPFLPAPGGLPDEAWRAAGLALAMALLWMTGALPLAATALVPLAVAPLLGLAPLAEIAPSYAHPVIVLFLGGFLIAKAIERSGLHLRLAYTLLGLAGRRPRRVLAATMGATAFLSLWISNTASALVIAPVAGAIASAHPEREDFGAALMLGVAFAATIGGMGSLIGTPPNALFAAYVERTHGVEIGFARWAAVGVPVALVLLAVAWAALGRLAPGTGRAPLATAFDRRLPPVSAAERRVAAVAGLAALAWIARPFAEGLVPGAGLSDAGIAMLAALALFVLPDGAGGRLLDWEGAATIRWDVLILFGGGLALAAILDATGLAAWIGGRVGELRALPPVALLLLMVALIVYVGELASNTAMAALFLPVAGAAAAALGAEPIAFLMTVALGASVGFMLPVATPPNAIVFSHPAVTRAGMLRAGAPLDAAGILVVVGLSSVLAPLVVP